MFRFLLFHFFLILSDLPNLLFIQAHTHTHTHSLSLSLSLSHTHTHTYIYIYVYIISFEIRQTKIRWIGKYLQFYGENQKVIHFSHIYDDSSDYFEVKVRICFVLITWNLRRA